MSLRLIQHEIGRPGCATDWHCHSHHVDEWKPHAYVGCGECGHVFPRRWDLWRDHQRLAAQLARYANHLARNPPWWADVKVPRWQPRRREALRLRLRALLTRPRRISACPHCAHDL